VGQNGLKRKKSSPENRFLSFLSEKRRRKRQLFSSFPTLFSVNTKTLDLDEAMKASPVDLERLRVSALVALHGLDHWKSQGRGPCLECPAEDPTG